LPVDIRLAAHANRLRFRPRAYSHFVSVPMLDIFKKPIRDWDSVAKRGFDIFFTIVALALLHEEDRAFGGRLDGDRGRDHDRPEQRQC
ncbi:hypothetical protein ACC674_38105, partial [Rhizobium ruizarguesonis]